MLLHKIKYEEFLLKLTKYRIVIRIGHVVERYRALL